MKKIFLFLVSFLTFFSVKAQSCDGIPCIANPVIIQADIIECSQPALDSSQNQNWYCPEEECLDVCENTANYYSTPYNAGSIYVWNVTGGQVINTNPLGNNVTVVWGSVGQGLLTVEELDVNGCDNFDVLCVKIKVTPQASIQTLPNSSVFCKDVPIKFKAIDINPSQLTQQFDDSCSANQQWPIDSTQYYYSMHYLWDFGDGTSSVIYNPIHSYATSGTKTITLIMSNNCQCSDTITMQIQITNDVGPKVISCIGALCEGDTAQYCTDAISPNWLLEGGSFYYSTSTDVCVNVIWDNNDNSLIDGEGTLIVSDFNTTCGSGETYFSVPVLTANPEITGKTIVCPNTYEVYSYECIPGVNYYWSVSGGIIVGGQNSSEIKVEWNYQVSGQVTLFISSSTLDCNLGQTSVNVEVLPRIEIYGSTQVCEGGINSFDENIWSNTLEWNAVNGSIISPASPPFIASQIQVEWNQGYGNASVNAVATQTGIYCQESALFPLQVIEKPQQVTSVNGDSIICPGASYYYSAQSNSTSTENWVYQWSVIGGTASSTKGETVMITWDPVGPFSIDVINHLDDSPYCNSDVFTKIINAVSIQPPVISGSSTVCINTISTFDLSTIYPEWAEISWSVSNAILGSVTSGQGTAQVQVEWGNQTGVTDVVIDVDVCGVIYSSTFSISFLTQPISFSVTNSPICSESSLSFTSTAGTGVYAWNFGDGTTSTSQNPSQNYAEPGAYLVSLTFTEPLSQCVSSYSSVLNVQGIAGHLFPEGTSSFCASSNISQPLSISTISSVIPSVEWFHNGSSVSTANFYTVTSSPPNQNGVGSYSVVLTDANGCSNTLNSINISTINCSGGGGGGSSCPPVVPLTYNSTCNSGLGTMSFNFNSPNGNIISWKVGNGPTSSSLVYLPIFSKAGVYKVQAFSSGCLLGSEIITVPLVVDIDYSAVCDPGNGNQITYHFQDTSSYLLGYGVSTYLWDFGDGTTSTSQNPSHTYAVSGSYSVDLTVNYGSYSCNKTITVVVYDFNVSYSHSGLECEDIPTITFTSSTTSPTTIVSWSWVFGDGASSGRETPMRTYNPSSIYSTTLQVTDGIGCVANASLPISIKQNPIINSLNSLGPYCSNDSPVGLFSVGLQQVVDFNTVNGEVATWSGIGIEQDPITQIYYFNPMLAGGGNYKICVTVTDNNGCYSTECIMIDVLCPEKPKIFGESDFCYDYSSHYYTTQYGYSNYQWYDNNVPVPGSNWSGYSFYNSSTTDLTVEFTDDNGCTTMSEPFTITVNPKPNIFYASFNGDLCPEKNIILEHNGNENNVEYFWNTPEKHNASTITITSESNYDYYVVASNQYGCITKSNYISLHQAPNMCAILSGCYCDSSILNQFNLINISGVSDSWMYNSTEWLRNGLAMTPPVTNNNLQLDPTSPNYLNTIPATFNQKVTDSYGCVYFSADLNLETNCTICFEESYTEISDTICDGDTYVLGTTTYTVSGNHISSLTGVAGCDSTVELNLFVKPIFTFQNPQFICDGEFYQIASSTYNTTGIYTDILIAENGCDSIVNTSLTVNPLLTNINNVEICFGDSVLVGSNYYTSAGSYIDVFSNLNTCDSVITTNLNILPYSSFLNIQAICDGDFIEVGQSLYYNAGIFTDILLNINGCDSVITTDITVYPTFYTQQYLQICEGDSTQVGQNYYNTTGIYVDSFNTVYNCDSVIYTDLFIENPIASISASPPLLALTVANGILPYSFEVGNQNGIILTSNNNSTTTVYFNPVVNGMYYFIVIDDIGCVSDTFFYNVTFLATTIHEFVIKDLLIFPNPSRNIFNISFTSKTQQNLRVRVLNVVGEELISDDLQQFIGEYTKHINLKEHAKGIYFLEIETDKGVVNKKLILH